MKTLLLLVTLTLAAGLVSSQKYPEKYDQLDLEQILSNKRLTKTYIKCILELGRCSPEAKELKGHISEALGNGCARCTNNQREGARRVIAHLIKHEPDAWKQLVEKYDPERVYTSKYDKELRSLG
uniref:Putative chemosensory protein 14 n=1 Tax=Conopomorpha sinensis TaxID=940481 RepID=A0A649ZUN1_9NEOP|nr:putative chemosensory protein 14 [Conopomorpha sinensis]